jgi:hypothetical protein
MAAYISMRAKWQFLSAAGKKDFARWPVTAPRELSYVTRLYSPYIFPNTLISQKVGSSSSNYYKRVTMAL